MELLSNGQTSAADDAPSRGIVDDFERRLDGHRRVRAVLLLGWGVSAALWLWALVAFLFGEFDAATVTTLVVPALLAATAMTGAGGWFNQRHARETQTRVREWRAAAESWNRVQTASEAQRRIVESVLREQVPAAAFATLFRMLVPRPKRGWAAFFPFRDGPELPRFSRALSRSATRELTLCDQLRERFRKARYSPLSEAELRRTAFVNGLSTEDRHKTRALHAFRIGPAGEPVGVVVASQLFPAGPDGENGREWSQEVIRQIDDHLTSLLQDEESRASDALTTNLVGDGTASGREVSEFTVEQFLLHLRELLGVDRAALLWIPHANDQPPEQLAVSSRPVSPGIERTWGEHERRLAAETPAGTTFLHAAALRAIGVESIVGSAAVAPVLFGETHRAVLVLTRRGPWVHRPGEAVYIAGCCDCLAERFTSRTSNATQDAGREDDVDAASLSAREEFLAVMSHELRTPVSAILGMTELALESQIPPEQREYLSLVHSSSESMLAMLNDVLDLSKAEAGQLELSREEFDLRTTVGEILKSVAFRIHEKGLEFCLQIDPRIPDRLVGDPLRLRQVLVNLIGNAAKFTERGEIVVDVRPASESANDCLIRFAVRDTGVGISPAAQQRIFSKYAQADATISGRFGGTGLGLAICREIVEQMGGRIGVDSTPGEGSTFHFTAKFAFGRSPAFQKSRASDPLVQTALVVDDHARTRETLREMVEAAGVECRTASNCGEAIEILAGRQQTDDTVILLDAQLASADSLLEAVCRMPAGNRPRVVLLKTMLVSVGDTVDRDCVADTLLKPVHPGEVLRVLKRADVAGEHPQPDISENSNGTPHRFRGMRMLLAEDDSVNQYLAENVLGAAGIDVTAVQNGREAMDAVQREAFDLVLMDVMMPELDGMAATGEIRDWEITSGSRIPIIAMTARVLPEDRRRCKDAGMDAFLEKPLSLARFAAGIDELVAQGLIAEWPSMSGSDSGNTQDDNPQSAIPNPQFPDDESALLDEVAELFREICPEYFETLKAAVEAGDAPAAELAAHSLKGAASCIEADELVQLLFDLEQAAAENRLDEETVENVGRVEAAIARITGQGADDFPRSASD